MTEPDIAAIERQLSAARERLAAMRAGSPVPPPDRAPTGSASSAPATAGRDGTRIRASAENGRVTAVEFADPRVLRLGADELSCLLVTALNAALAGAEPTAADAGGVDLDLIARQLRDVEEEALGTLHRTMSALQAAVGQLQREAHVTMPVGIPDFHDLFAAAEESVAAARGRRSLVPDDGDGDGDDLGGEGRSDPRGLVRASVTPSGTVASATLDPMALRRPSHELAGLVVAAVNAALDGVRARRREHREKAAAERAERIRAVQDRSIGEMKTFCDAMTRLMGSIRPLS